MSLTPLTLTNSTFEGPYLPFFNRWKSSPAGLTIHAAAWLRENAGHSKIFAPLFRFTIGIPGTPYVMIDAERESETADLLLRGGLSSVHRFDV